MITKLGRALLNANPSAVDKAFTFVTDKIRRPVTPQELYVPPVKRKRVDENGNILKKLVGFKGDNKYFGKENIDFLFK